MDDPATNTARLLVLAMTLAGPTLLCAGCGGLMGLLGNEAPMGLDYWLGGGVAGLGVALTLLAPVAWIGLSMLSKDREAAEAREQARASIDPEDGWT